MGQGGYSLVNMKLDPKKREEMPESAVVDRPLYPWGLEVRLDNDVLDKLDLGSLPDAGATLLLHARVEVTGVQESKRAEDKGGGIKRDRSVTLQITDLALEADKAEDRKGTADTLYGG